MQETKTDGEARGFSAEAWEKEALSRFKDLLRLDTVNPPGNEQIAAGYLAKVLEEAGIAATIVEAAPTRASVIGRLRGTGKKRPLLLAGHTDVVPVERSAWTHDPFGAEEAEEHIWGRGAIDMKNMIAMSLMTVLRLKREGIPLERDVIFCAVADEEEGCRYGSRFVVEEHPSLVEAEYMLGEIGGFTMHVGKKVIYPIQVAEKGRVRLKMIARGQPGHASMPFPNSAVHRLAHAIEALGRRPLPYHKTAPAENFITALADSQGLPTSAVLRLLLQPALSGFLLDHVLPKPLVGTFRAALHNTVAPTILQAGAKLNVIPSEAICLLDGRLLPGFTGADLVREIRAVVGADVDVQIEEESKAVVNPHQTELYRLLEAKIRQHDPEGIPIPFLIPGFTDACQFSRLGIVCYGFSPLKIPKGAPYTFTQLFHGHNERISKDGFLWGLRTLYDTVKTFCRAS